MALSRMNGVNSSPPARFTSRKGVGAVLIVLLITALWNLVGQGDAPPDPAHQGRPLSSWLHDLDMSQDTEDLAARQAIRAIGTNGLPLIISRLRSRDVPFRDEIRSLLGRWIRLQPARPSGSVQRYQAASALHVLGTAAVPAAPELLQLLDQGTYLDAVGALHALRAMGTGGLAGLSHALRHEDPDIRWGAAVILGEMGQAAVGSEPQLRRAMESDPNAEVRKQAGESWKGIHEGKTPETVGNQPTPDPVL